jgi:hypothetical protein
MPRLYQTGVWKAHLPDGWLAKDLLFDGAIFFRSDGVGQLMVALPPDSESPPPSSSTGERFAGKLQGFTWTFKWNGNLMRLWQLSCGGRTLLATYQCALSHVGVEEHAVDDILCSIAELDRDAG